MKSDPYPARTTIRFEEGVMVIVHSRADTLRIRNSRRARAKEEAEWAAFEREFTRSSEHQQMRRFILD
jgi:hypothetical protein